jgi:hypothetical protein
MNKKIAVLLLLALLLGTYLTFAQPIEARPPLEKRVFIHYRRGLAKPARPAKGQPSCYGFLAKEAKWKEFPINYIVEDASLSGAVMAAASEWDNGTGASLFGDCTVDSTITWTEDYNGQNELLFGDYPQDGVIAITYAWGYFSGPPKTREIVEFDILFDTDFTWGDVDEFPSVMDLQNIATHELGHGLGLDDVYQTSCSEVTMFGYSAYGETSKRDLEPPDIEGLLTLYPY